MAKIRINSMLVQKILKILCFSLIFSTLIATPLLISSCSKNESKYVGNWNGTDWKGYKGGSLTCTINDDGKSVTINNANWYAADNLIIPDKIKNNGKKYIITKIADNAFYDDWNLSGALTLPNSLISLGTYQGEEPGCFDCCIELTKIIFGNSLTSIGHSCFFNCPKLSGNLLFPNSLNEIGSCAFYGCNGLSGDLSFSKSIQRIGSEAFSGCDGLGEKLTISNDQIYIGNAAFSSCSEFTEIHISGFEWMPENTWGDDLFSGWKRNGIVTFDNTDAGFDNILAYLKEHGLPNTWAIRN